MVGNVYKRRKLDHASKLEFSECVVEVKVVASSSGIIPPSEISICIMDGPIQLSKLFNKKEFDKQQELKL